MPPRKREPTPAAGGKSSGRGARSAKPPKTTKGGASTRGGSKPPPPPADPPPEEPADLDTFGRLSVATPADTADLAGYYGQLITVSRVRSTKLGDLLADQYERKGLDALRRITYTATPDGGAEPSGEVVTALARLEMDERRTLERLLVKAAELGLELRSAAAKEQHAAAIVGVLMAFAERLGLDQQDPDVRRKMQLAVLEARKTLPGHT